MPNSDSEPETRSGIQISVSRFLKHYHRDAILSLITRCILLASSVVLRVFPVTTIVFFALGLIILVLG